MNETKKNFTQEEIDVLFCVVNKWRRVKNRELNKKEIENLILKVRSIAQS